MYYNNRPRVAVIKDVVELNIQMFILQSYLKVSQDVKLNSGYFFLWKLQIDMSISKQDKINNSEKNL